MIDLLLIHGTVITMDQNRRILQDGAIAIHQGRILAVDSTEKLKLKYEAVKVIDCRPSVHIAWVDRCSWSWGTFHVQNDCNGEY